jgi:phage terminase large subunit-like protein
MRRFCRIELYEWQKKELRECGGETRPRVSFTQVPRKNGKSLVAGALALTELVLLEDRHVYAISDSERNLNSVLMREIRGLINRSPELSDAIHIFQQGLECPQSGSFMEVRPGNFKASQGINPHLVIFDEVHLQKTDEIWAGMQMSGAAREDALLYGITTPGQDTTGLAHRLYEEVKSGSNVLRGTIYEPLNPECDIDDREAWRQANPCYDRPGFLEALEYDRQTLPEHQFRCFRLGQWGYGVAEHAIPLDAWDRCAGEVSIEPLGAVWVGVDAALSRDSSAISVCFKDPDGKFHTRTKIVWADPDNGMDFAALENHIREIGSNYYIQEVAYDPFAFQRSAQVLEEEGIRMVQVRQDNSNMVPASQALFDAVVGGNLVHDGDIAVRAQIEAAVSKQVERGWRLSKQKSRAPIDAAIALSLAVWRASLGVEQYAAPRLSIL